MLERDGSREGVARAAAARGGKLYRRTQEGVSMGWRSLSLWALSALWHSAVCFAVPTLALAGGGGGGSEASASSLHRFLGLAGGGPHASSEGLWQTGTLGFTLVVVVVNLKLLVSSRAHTFWHVLVVALSVGAYSGYLVVYSSLSPAGAVLSRIAPAAAVYGVAGELARNPAAWIALVVGTAGCLLPDVALSSVARRQQRQKGGGEEEGGEGGGEGGGKRGGGGAPATAATGSVVSEANAKAKSSSNKNSSGKLKAGGAAEEAESSSSSSAVAAALLPPVSSSSAGRPPLHPLRSVSLQSRISELQQQRHGVAGGVSNDANSSTTTTTATAASSLPRRSSAAAFPSPPSSTSASSTSARHTGYAFDHPGFESFFYDEAEREVRRTTSLSARVSGGGGGGGGAGSNAAASVAAASSSDDAASSAAATAATSVSGDALFSPLPLPDGASAGGDNNNIIIDGGISSTSEQLQIQRLSSSGRRYTATDALDLA